jgi:hypothetical protein
MHERRVYDFALTGPPLLMENTVPSQSQYFQFMCGGEK